MASSNTAPTTDMISPADCPSWYQPTALPSQVATIDPAMPSRMVTMNPPGSLPGVMSLASAPATEANQYYPKPMHLSPPIAHVEKYALQPAAVYKAFDYFGTDQNAASTLSAIEQVQGRAGCALSDSGLNAVFHLR